MKKFLLVQILFTAFLLIPSATSSYGAGDFSQYYNKGIEFYKQGKYDQAGKEFEKALEVKPNDVYALYGLGNTYYCKAQYDDAVKIYTKAININPDYAKVHYSLSLAYSKLGMTREAEKQKAMFRKLSQGGTSAGTSTHAQPSHTSARAKIDHSPKKSLSHAQKKSLHETQQAVTHETRDTHAAGGHEIKQEATHETRDTHAAGGHEIKQEATHETRDTHAAGGHEIKQEATHETHDRHAAKTHDTHVTTHERVDGESHTIFKGYTGETHEAEERVFKKKRKPQGTYSFSTKPLRSVKYYIQDKWYSSGVNKIWICAAGYIFGTQIWLCVVAFFCIIVWRIREKA